jgi:hypothetical protein
VAPPDHVHLGPLSRRVVEGARWQTEDEYPAFQLWADELERVLGFLVAQNRFDEFFPRLHDQPREHRSAALAEARCAFFLHRNGFRICDWEPLAVGRQPGDFSVCLDPAAPIFVEVKAPTWQGELGRELQQADAARREWLVARIKEEKYRNAEGRFVDPVGTAIDVVARNAVPKFAADRPNLVAILDDLFLTAVGNPLLIPKFREAFKTKAEFRRVGGVMLLQLENYTGVGDLLYRCDFIANENCEPACALPAGAAATLRLIADESAAAHQRLMTRLRGPEKLEQPRRERSAIDHNTP